MTSSPYLIRRGTVADAAALAEVAAFTFVETFGHLYVPEDLEEYLQTTHAPAAYARVLVDPTVGVWLAGREGEPPAGYVVVGSCKLPVKNLEPNAGEIRQLYVRGTHQNARLGTRLMDIALDWLAQQGRAPLYVGVWSENFGAQRLYGRYGFEKFGEYGFPVGRTVDHEFILKQPANYRRPSPR